MTLCKCGHEVTRVEVRVVQRCSRGHFVTSGAAPAILAAAGPQPHTPGQQRAFHAKCNAIDKARELKLGTTKARVLHEAGHASSTELDSLAMSATLDALELELAGLE
jgi:hypothetical protein